MPKTIFQKKTRPDTGENFKFLIPGSVSMVSDALKIVQWMPQNQVSNKNGEKFGKIIRQHRVEEQTYKNRQILLKFLLFSCSYNGILVNIPTQRNVNMKRAL